MEQFLSIQGEYNFMVVQLSNFVFLKNFNFLDAIPVCCGDEVRVNVFCTSIERFLITLMWGS